MRGALGDKGGEDASWASQTELKAPWPSARTRTRVVRDVEVLEERVYPGLSVGSNAESDSVDSMDWIAGTTAGGLGVESGSSRALLRRSVGSSSLIWYREGKRRWRRMGRTWVSGTNGSRSWMGEGGRVAKKAEVLVGAVLVDGDGSGGRDRTEISEKVEDAESSERGDEDGAIERKHDTSHPGHNDTARIRPSPRRSHHQIRIERPLLAERLKLGLVLQPSSSTKIPVQQPSHAQHHEHAHDRSHDQTCPGSRRIGKRSRGRRDRRIRCRCRVLRSRSVQPAVWMRAAQKRAAAAATRTRFRP